VVSRLDFLGLARSRPQVLRRHLANATVWDPPLLAPGATVALFLELRGADVGDLTMCGPALGTRGRSSKLLLAQDIFANLYTNSCY
jgi:hypothetical protein